MVISHKHKFLFVHIPKNAGTSITHALKGFGEVVVRPTQHQRLCEVEQTIDLTNYKIFAVVRNPWDRLLSFYNYMSYRGKLSSDVTFTHFIQLIQSEDPLICSWRTVKYNQCDFIKDVGWCVGVVSKYEQLETNWILLRKYLKLPLPELEHLNKFSEGGTYRDHYTDDDRDFVGRYYAKDVNMYEYEF